MSSVREKVDDFLAQRRIAVAGVSRGETAGAANLVYRKLRTAGYEVFAVNPNAEVVEGDRCYPDLKSIPETVDAVVIATRPQTSETIVRQCAQLGITRAWMHRSFGTGSVSEAATQFCHDNNIEVIPGGCPMMFSQPVDFGHKCMRWLLGAFGGLPK